MSFQTLSTASVCVFAVTKNAVYASLALSPAVSPHSCRASFGRGTRQTGHLTGAGGGNGVTNPRGGGSQLRFIPRLPHLTLLFLDNRSSLLE